MTDTEQAEAALVGKMEIRVGGRYHFQWSLVWEHSRPIKILDFYGGEVRYVVGKYRKLFPFFHGDIQSLDPKRFGENLRLHRVYPKPKPRTMVVDTPNLI